MHVYDFISKNITEKDVKRIIAHAGYNTADYTYTQRVDNDGFTVKGEEPMSLTSLRNAAKDLGITVEIYSPPSGYELTAVAFADVAVNAGTQYRVNIKMTPDTVRALDQGNYKLYGFKAVKSNNKGGAPLVWFKSENYSAITNVKWLVQYQAYTSNSDIIPNGEIIASFVTDIDLAQTLEVESSKGIGSVKRNGTAGAISIQNKVAKSFTCGISQMTDNDTNPMCAFPLYGNQLDVIAPIEKVLLMFATESVNTGTVIEKAYSRSILIDLTSAPGNQRMVQFDINNGWDWAKELWAEQYEANQELAPLLIVNS
jgi:hypothetical protein